MANDHMFLAKVKGADPEQFFFITVSEDWGSIKSTGDPMTEEETRAALHNAGMPEMVINSRIEHAREHPI